MSSVAPPPHVVHALPGRLRVHLATWDGAAPGTLHATLSRLPGVTTVQVNAVTHNALLTYDPQRTDERTLLPAIERAITQAAETPGPQRDPRERIRTHVEREGKTVRARIAIPGLDRNPALAKTVVERLRQRDGVRVSLSTLTGRVLVEYSEHEDTLDDILADLVGMDLPDSATDHPRDPMDPAPLVQSTTRTVGAGLGLTYLTTRAMFGAQGDLPGATVAGQVAGFIGILQGLPFVRNSVRRVLGRDKADLAFSVPGIAALTISSSPLGLALVAAESVRLLTEVVARRSAWRRYTSRLAGVDADEPGAVIRLESGERTPLEARIIDGTGTATGRDGLPTAVAPGREVSAGARLYGGPFKLQLGVGPEFIAQPRPAPPAPTILEHYTRAMGPVSLGYAALTAITTRSLARTLEAILLVNPRTALIGTDAAETGASARILRAGAIVVGTRVTRSLRCPDLLLLDGPRVLTEGYELTSTLPLRNDLDPQQVLLRAAAVARAAGSPWGGIFRTGGGLQAEDGHYDGGTATALIDGQRFTLGLVTDWGAVPAAAKLRQRGDYVLELRAEGEKSPLGLVALRPRLSPKSAHLSEVCERYGVRLLVLARGDAIAARAVARRARITLAEDEHLVPLIRAAQRRGAIVWVASDSAEAAAAFDAADLGIGLIDGRSRLHARADILVPDVGVLTEVVMAGHARQQAVRDSVGLSVISNVIGGVLGFPGVGSFANAPFIERAARVMYTASIAAVGVAWLRLRGGERRKFTTLDLPDPHPERWGRESPEQVLHALDSRPEGLRPREVEARRQAVAPPVPRHAILKALAEQVRSPLVPLLAGGAALSLVVGAPADAAIILLTIGANVAVGVWQERKADQVTATLARLSTPQATVLRDGQRERVAADQLVPGDILVLATGDRVAADARLLRAEHLEVDEASLTGESLPVRKVAIGGTEASRVVLDGSDVTSGRGEAVVVAVGRRTRLGATISALATEDIEHESPLDQRLGKVLRQVMPLAIGSGAVVAAAGFARTRLLLPQVAMGASVTLAAVPEGMPLLTKVSEAAVAYRLSTRRAVVRRLASIEAMGRVDVACTDKTGTLTEGRLVLRVVASASVSDGATNGGAANDARDVRDAGGANGARKAAEHAEESERIAALPPNLRQVLLAAALASPHPDAPDAAAHQTDQVVLRGAETAGLSQEMRAPREREAVFDPMRAFHAATAVGRLYVKGAPEAVLARCERVREWGGDAPLDDAGRARMLARAKRLAERGLRVLAVAEGAGETAPTDPEHLTALGFIGISDPLRPDVPAAVRRCHEAGIRVIMLTGDHPATARTIAHEAGLLTHGGEVLTGDEIAELHNGDLDARLAHAAVIARATPLDKLRIIESLQRQEHVVAMTGDGVNDAPALRLADVGVAMGQAGSEVARQTADVVLTDDDFSTLVEALVEGRSFWRNMRRAIALLLGGNLGELGLIVGASALSLGSPLLARQILVVNMITDVLPALAVALQKPEHHHLAELSREGASALDRALRDDVLRRGFATAVPSLAAYLGMRVTGLAPAAGSVAFGSIIATQLAQTLDAGKTEGGLTRPVVAAVGGSAGLLLAALTVPRMRTFLGLVTPPPLGWALIGGSAIAAVGLSHVLAAPPLLPGVASADDQPPHARRGGASPGRGRTQPGVSDALAVDAL